MATIDAVFDEAVKLVLSERVGKGVEVAFDTFQERENFRIRLYRQKQILTKTHPDMATNLGIKAITDKGKGEFKIQLYYIKPVEFKVVTIAE